jgi:hypothetical protein
MFYHDRVFEPGRAAFSSADAPPAVIVNETFARLAWPGQDAIGRRIKPGSSVALRNR